MLETLFYLFGIVGLVALGFLVAQRVYLPRLRSLCSQIEALQLGIDRTQIEAEIYRRQLVAPETYKQEFQTLPPWSKAKLRPYTKIEI